MRRVPVEFNTGLVGFCQKVEQEPCYRRDHRAMRPLYECPDNNASAKSADDCARISTGKLFSKYSIQHDHGT